MRAKAVANSSSLNLAGRASGPRMEMVSPSHRLHALAATARSAARWRQVVFGLLVYGGWDGAQETLPGVRVQHGRAALVEPGELGPGQQEYAAQHQRLDALGMSHGVGEGQGRAPAAAEHGPLLRARLSAQALDVLHQRPGVVVGQHRVGARAAAAALVEQHHAPALGVEEAAHGGVDRAARAAVQDHARLAVGPAALLVVDLVRGAGGQPAEGEGLRLRVEGAARRRLGGRGAGPHNRAVQPVH